MKPIYRKLINGQIRIAAWRLEIAQLVIGRAEKSEMKQFPMSNVKCGLFSIPQFAIQTPVFAGVYVSRHETPESRWEGDRRPGLVSGSSLRTKGREATDLFPCQGMKSIYRKLINGQIRIAAWRLEIAQLVIGRAEKSEMKQFPMSNVQCGLFLIPQFAIRASTFRDTPRESQCEGGTGAWPWPRVSGKQERR